MRRGEARISRPIRAGHQPPGAPFPVWPTRAEWSRRPGRPGTNRAAERRPNMVRASRGARREDPSWSGAAAGAAWPADTRYRASRCILARSAAATARVAPMSGSRLGERCACSSRLHIIDRQQLPPNCRPRCAQRQPDTGRDDDDEQNQKPSFIKAHRMMTTHPAAEMTIAHQQAKCLRRRRRRTVHRRSFFHGTFFFSVKTEHENARLQGSSSSSMERAPFCSAIVIVDAVALTEMTF